MPTSTAKVLLVEDEPLILFTLADYLREEGLEVVEGRDAVQALKALAIHSDISVVVTDVNMPGLIDGLELTQIVKRQFPLLPVIVCSGRVRKEQMPFGAIFIPKPYRLEDMSKLIMELILSGIDRSPAAPHE